MYIICLVLFGYFEAILVGLNLQTNEKSVQLLNQRQLDSLNRIS